MTLNDGVAPPGGRNQGSYALAPYTTTSSYVEVPGSECDLRQVKGAVSFQAIVATNTVKIAHFVANKADFSDEVQLHEDTGVVAGTYRYLLADLGAAYYRAKAADNSGGSHGVVTGTVQIKR